MADHAYLERLTKELTAQGMLIEAGFIGLRLAAIPDDAPADQLEEMRNAFFAGAAHLFSSITSILDPGEEPTDADLKRMSQINDELNAFIDKFSRKHKLGATPPSKPASAPQTLGDAPIEEKYRARMNELAQFIDHFFNGDKKGAARTAGFVLLISDFGHRGRANYISNIDRDDVVILLKEQIKRFEGQPEIEGHA